MKFFGHFGLIDVNYAKVPRARKLPVRRQRMATLRWMAEKSLAALLFNIHARRRGTRIRATTDATMQLAIINCAPAVTMAVGREREPVGWLARIIPPRKKSHERGALSDRWFLIVLRERERILWNSFGVHA